MSFRLSPLLLVLLSRTKNATQRSVWATASIRCRTYRTSQPPPLLRPLVFGSSLSVCGFALRRTSTGFLAGSSCFTPPISITRRFIGGGHRSPTFTEISESCSILGIDVDCDPKQVKKIYRDLVKKNHPDAGGDAAAMSRITVAYNRLSSLSNLEKEQFKVQRNAYRGGSYYSTPAPGSSHRGGTGQYPGRSSAFYHPGGGSYHTGASRGFYDTSTNSDYFRQGSSSQQGYYNYQQRSREYAENPFSTKYPFSIHAQIRRAWTMPMGTIFLRGFVAYLALSACLLLFYRKFRDWQHDDGWKMSESLARHEQLSELHRIRQEMNERIRAAREAAAAQRGFVGHVGGSARDYNTTTMPNRELQALEYARRRQIEISEANKGWPEFAENKGKLIHRAQDPPGVVFFEPRKEDICHRQVENLRRGRERSELGMHPSVAVSPETDPTRNMTTSGAALPHAGSAGQMGENDAMNLIRNIFGGALGVTGNTESKAAE